MADGHMLHGPANPRTTASDAPNGCSNGIMRLFVAIALPPEAASELDEVVAPLRPAWPDLRWTGRDAWHLTLAFLGEVDELVTAELAVACLMVMWPSCRPWLQRCARNPNGNVSGQIHMARNTGCLLYAARAYAMPPLRLTSGPARRLKFWSPALHVADGSPPVAGSWQSASCAHGGGSFLWQLPWSDWPRMG